MMEGFSLVVEQARILAPAYVPLGMVGAWRWGVWLLKRLTSYFYRPVTASFETSVSVVTPVYNETPEIFRRALESWRENRVDEIVAVIDYTDEKCVDVFVDFARTFPRTKLIVTRKPGKREALADGVRAAASEIVALVDSDTIWDDKVRVEALKPFRKPKMGGVTVRQRVLEVNTMAQRLFNSQQNVRFADEYRFLTALGGSVVHCLSGRTAFYRRSALLPVLDDLLHETFWGQKVISGDDKRLTYLIEAAGWQATYQSTASVYTPGAETMNQFIKQRLRWARNSWRADMRALTQGWVWRKLDFALFLIDRAVQPFVLLLGPIYFISSLLLGLWVPALTLLVWWHVSRIIRLWPHLTTRPRDVAIIPMYIAINYFFGLVKLYALFTLNRQGWITRWDQSRLTQLTWLRLVPAYAAMSITLFALTGSVFAYKSDILEGGRGGEYQPLLVQTADGVSLALSVPELKVGEAMLARHVVVQGDTPRVVAEKYGVSWEKILAVNSAYLPNGETGLAVGQVLSIPLSDEVPLPARQYTTNHDRRGDLLVEYDAAANTVEVRGRGRVVTLSDIRRATGGQHIREIVPGEWYLTANLHINVGVTLRLTSAEVKWLKLASSREEFVWLRSSNSTIIMDGVKITSWDDSIKDYDVTVADGRAFVVAKLGSRMDIMNGEIAYLGYEFPPKEDASNYGVSWQIPNGTSGQYLLTGHIENTDFHHNYFGAYTFGATAMEWRGNEFYDNVRYGLDPHDDSNYFVIERNQAYRNGSHGIILSKRCIGNLIQNNISHDNALHGIMLHEDTNGNVVRGNVAYGNRDGVALFDAHNNAVVDNSVYNNERGIRLNDGSSSNLVARNRINGQAQYGLYLYGAADGNALSENELVHNGSAFYVKSSGNELERNVVRASGIGVYLLGEANGNVLSGNVIGNSFEFDVYTKTQEGAQNFLSET